MALGSRGLLAAWLVAAVGCQTSEEVQPSPPSTSDPTASESDSSDSDAPPASCDEAPEPAGDDCPTEICASCDETTCFIECLTTSACERVSLTCPDGWNCSVRCGAEGACRDGTIACPEGHGCTVSCNGPSACENLELDCGGGPCNAHCVGEHADNCTGLTFACGEADSRLRCDSPADLGEMVDNDAGCLCESVGC